MRNENERYYKLADLLELFPALKPSTIDYLTREKHISCIRFGKGRPRRFPSQAIDEIRAYLSRSGSTDIS